ncbi:putative Glutamate--tRNA ligase [Blattamonas nauphoetae]|uniref:glutamate--tRNA ligase n=1 Tax=Blattamonas nauphoetae TaxID=2049346 RepID=A0ABQ9XK51_9EUKA|nr:putative Glutamate--tRNA ligase [Blattamonas nauphoetae]
MKITYQNIFPWCSLLTGNAVGAKFVRELGENDTIRLTNDDNSTVEGDVEIAISLSSGKPVVLLEGQNATNVSAWKDFALSKLRAASQSQTTEALVPLLNTINDHLSLRTYLVGYSLSLADILVWGTLKNSQSFATIKKEDRPHLSRWFAFCEDQGLFKSVGALIRSKPAAPKPTAAPVVEEKPVESTGPTDPAERLRMPNICNNITLTTSNLVQVSANFETGISEEECRSGNVVTRFPPEPSGYLHIGHIKAALLQEYYARHSNGKLVLRFDDTNPAKEKKEFEDAIIDDLKSIGFVPDMITYTSDYFPLIYDYGTKMLEMGKAYIDDLPVDIMRENRNQGIDSPSRNLSVEENMKRWEEMHKNTPLGKTYVMRAKINMQATNTTLRDPVLFRSVQQTHPRHGDKFKIYPSYDFACPIVDSLEGVTVAMRTIEYRDRNEQFYWMQDALGLRRVRIRDFARLNFLYTELSKRKLQWFVDSGIAPNWDDPRFPTLQGVMRRGMTIPALRAFVLEQGPSRNITYQEWDKIWAKNRQVIDPICPRYTAIECADAVTLTITDGPEPYVSVVPRHRKNPATGDKLVQFAKTVLIEQVDGQAMKEGEEVTLMGWGNVIVDTIAKEGDKVKAITAHLHLEGDFKKTALKLTWLAYNDPASLHVAKMMCFDNMLTKAKLEENDTFEEFVNRDSVFGCDCYIEPAAKDGVEGDIVQFERKGYFFLDHPLTTKAKHAPASNLLPGGHKEGQMVFHYIPDGRSLLMKIGGKFPKE